MKQFLGQLKELQDKLDKFQPAILEEVVEHLVRQSPDDTGAYILSHSIGRSGNVGRHLNPKDRVSAPNTHRGEAWDRLMGQVASIPPDASRIWIGNNAPHASAVENGGHNWKRPGYFVYTTLKAKFGLLVSEAKNKAGLT